MHTTETVFTFGGGLLTGAALMFLFDPVRGRARRAYARDQLISAGHEAGDAFDEAGRDLRYRSRGLLAELAARLRREQVSDEVLVERVRSKLGRFTSHPRAIEVTAEDRCVRLSGAVLQ